MPRQLSLLIAGNMSFPTMIAQVSGPSAMAILAALVLVYFAWTVVYGLYLHPLAGYPGPLWAKISSIPSYWHALKQDRHLWLHQLQEKYGPTFRHKPNSLLINTPAGFRAIYGPKGNVTKAPGFYLAWPRNADSHTVVHAIDSAVHARKRRVLNYSLSDRAVRSAEKYVLSNTNRWCELLSAAVSGGPGGDLSGQWSGPLNMSEWANYLVFDILGDLCFGRQFGTKEDPGDGGQGLRPAIHLIAAFMAFMHPIALSPIARPWIWLKPRGLDRLLERLSPTVVKEWRKFVEQCLVQRTAAELEEDEAVGNEGEGEAEGGGEGRQRRRDFFHYLYHAVDPNTGGPGFTPGELYGESELLIVAGSDTTSTVVSSLVFYLARNERAQARLASEVRAAFSTAEGVAPGSALRSCKYLRAVIQEGLRLTTPVGGEAPRIVRGGGTEVEGVWFPAGVEVSTAFYCLSHNPDVYPEPFRFRPERWIVDEKEGVTEGSVAIAESGACAFSMGARGCPAKSLAWMEMSVVMAKLAHMFEMRQDPGNSLGGGGPGMGLGREREDEYQTYDVFVALRDGPMIQFKRRQ